MITYFYIAIVILTCGIDDGTRFTSWMSEPYDPTTEMACYERGAFFYDGPTVTMYSNSTKEINWNTLRGKWWSNWIIEMIR